MVSKSRVSSHLHNKVYGLGVCRIAEREISHQELGSDNGLSLFRKDVVFLDKTDACLKYWNIER